MSKWSTTRPAVPGDYYFRNRAIVFPVRVAFPEPGYGFVSEIPGVGSMSLACIVFDGCEWLPLPTPARVLALEEVAAAAAPMANPSSNARVDWDDYEALRKALAALDAAEGATHA